MRKFFSVAHPWLFAAFPVLFLFANNLNETRLKEIVIPLVVVVLAGGFCLVIANFFLRDLRRAGLVTSATFLLFFSYGHVWQEFGGKEIGSVYIDKDLYLLLPWTAISIVLIWGAATRRRSLKEITIILNAVALVLVAGPAYSIATRGATSESPGRDCPPPIRSASASLSARGQAPPDIYYLVFDRYAPSSTLMRRFAFDNQPFIDYLKTKGFYVAEQSHANYPRTIHSIASSMNANFLDCVARNVGTSHQNMRPLVSSIQESAVGRFLKGLGYKYIHIGSWVDVTAQSPIADINYAGSPARFLSLPYSSSLARPIAEMFGLTDDWRESIIERARSQFRELITARTLPGPKFIFAHILLPHDPYIFTKEGRVLSGEDEYVRGETLNYTEQLQFTNAQIRKVFDALTSGPVSSHPIIVMQSDEGPHPPRFDRVGADFDWTEASPDELGDTLHIFNALYLPGQGDAGLYQTITPVNTFRRIFNLYLDARLPLLPDKSFVPRDERHPYLFVDVTERVQAAP